MAPTYPVPMPTTGVRSRVFELKTVDAVNEYVSGATSATQIAPDYWDIQITTTNLPLNSERWRLWRNFLDKLRGSKKLALLYDPAKPYPTAYSTFDGLTKVGGGAFTGQGNIKTVTSPWQVTVEGLPNEFILKATDYVGFVKSGRYTLHRIVEDVTSNSSGEAVLYIEGELPPSFTAGSGTVANFLRPYCEARLVPDSINDPVDVEGQPISFRARSQI